ncbi:(2Fe-2S)-binding protein [Mesorhizobium sp. VK25A]|uniref:(2Fe-2S)-binding protein n=1 Tax=Mesorhizobium vachelliae TaxID=3072309 RepID=A0ABU5AEB9_9HYPH|nr:MULTISPECIES: (2Fe-2S)-binding protein [unclassified Mesorhizobium]MDX8535626.1 (2Fe-2S)-binding protein [Mesorhizobium sp. VK25D]MDX8548379.1 (2Fe-2S)-binding protein [Mesorhizobium sp. VK25A]
MRIFFKVNGQAVETEGSAVSRLSSFLRDVLGLTGVKEGCCEGECGACTVLLDGRPVNSCLVLTFQAAGREVITVEGLGGSGDLQNAFLQTGAVQCGYCAPGILMAAEGLLRAIPNPVEAEIRHALAGNICRCTGFETIVQAVAAHAAARQGTY